MRNILWLIIGVMAGMGIEHYRLQQPQAEAVVKEVLVTKTDTVYYPQAPASTTMMGKERFMLPRYCFVGTPYRQEDAEATESTEATEEDSVEVELPIVHRHYADSAYEAWVSGPLAPRLDSVKVTSRQVVTTIERAAPKEKKWHVGVTAGYGCTAAGRLEPYIGIGITYSLFGI